MKLKEIVSGLVAEIADAIILMDGDKAPRYIWKGFIFTIAGIALWSFFMGYCLGSRNSDSLFYGHISAGSICGVCIFFGPVFMAAGIKAKVILKR